jgi:proteic killer suppression protein
MKIILQDAYLSSIATTNELVGKQKYPAEVVLKFRQRIFQISEAKNVQDLRTIKSFHLEKLKEPRFKDKYSIRLNKAYRLIFSIKHEKVIEIVVIEEINNHYG